MIDFFISDMKFTVSLVLTIVSLVLAFVFYYRSLNWKVPCYSKINKRIIDSDLLSLTPIKVLFKGKSIGTLSVLKIAFWNDGRATINGSDIVPTDKLRIVARNNCRILAAEVIKTNRPANNVEGILSQENNTVIVCFDFLDYKNGFVIKIYHTGENSNDIEVLGSIKGVNNIVDINRNEDSVLRLLEKFHTRSMDRVFQITPKWYWKIDEFAETRGFIAYLLVRVPMVIIVAPFAIVYLSIAMTLFFIALAMSIVNSGRYSLPREFYTIMKNA